MSASANLALAAFSLLVSAWLAAAVCAQDDGRDIERSMQAGRSLIDDRPADASQPAQELPTVDLQMRLKEVHVTSTPQGDRVSLDTDAGPVELTPEQYVAALQRTNTQLEKAGFFYKLFNISKPWGFLWISVGFMGQVMFTFRMVVQWWASEKHKRSVVPVSFWWGSLFGGAMLFAYFVWRKDIVGVVGQSTGVFVYTRNLVLIHRGRRIESEGARTLSEDEPDPDDDNEKD